MTFLHSLFTRTRELLSRPRVDREFEEEMRFHLEMEADLNRRAGMTTGEARRAAVLAFGGVERVRAETREARGIAPLENVARDVRYAARRLRRQPGFAVPAVATLGVGIGATAAIAALAWAVLVRPLPYPAADRLVTLRHAAPGLGVEDAGQSEGTYEHYRQGARTLEAVGAYLESDAVSITDGDQPERVRVAMVTPSLLPMLGATTSAGRLFVDADAADDGAVMISHALWMRRYGGDPAVIGRRVELNRRRRTVVGVMRPGFDFPTPGLQVWYAMGTRTTRGGVRDLHLAAIGRLAPGATIGDARRELARLGGTLPARYADVTPALVARAQLTPVVRPLRDALVGDVRQAILLLVGTAAFVLVIAWSNVANLALIRAERLRHEVAVSRALGAGTDDLVRRFLTESVLLATVSAGVAFLVAAAAISARFGLGVGEMPRLHELRVDGTLAAIVVALALTSGAGVGLVALARCRHAVLGLGGATARATAGRGGRRAVGALVGVQVALALTLLVGSAAMARSLWELQRVRLGFDPRGAVTFELTLPYFPYGTYQRSVALYETLLERLRAVPGVTAAEAVTAIPLTPNAVGLTEGIEVDGGGGRAATDVAPLAAIAFATPGYFNAMRIPLAGGRTFARGDVASGTPTVILSAALARALFPGGGAVGRRVRLAKFARYPAYTVVGVAGDVLGATIAGGPANTIYFPALGELAADGATTLALPFVPGNESVVVRTDLAPTTLVAAARRALREIDPQLPITGVRPLTQVVDAATARVRLVTLLLGVAAVAALFLGVVGVYGVVAYAVSTRTRELGIRIALGATPAAVRRMILRQGAVLSFGGAVAGVASAVAVTRFLRGQLYRVSPTDPTALAGATALLLAVALLASWLPARRAARIDPVRALKSE